GDRGGTDRVLQHKIPTKYPSQELAHRCVGVSVGAAGNRCHRSKLGVAQGGKDASHAGHRVGQHQGGTGYVFGCGTGGDENAGADDGADAKRGQRNRSQYAPQPMLPSHLVQQYLQRFLRKQLIRHMDPASYLLSTISVTGPSLTSSTCIIAPKRPVAVWIPCARTPATNSS